MYSRFIHLNAKFASKFLTSLLQWKTALITVSVFLTLDLRKWGRRKDLFIPPSSPAHFQNGEEFEYVAWI